MTSPADGGSGDDRRYGGRSGAERRADRRQRLIEAGTELVGTLGFERASIERLCLRAGVSTRYFYEEFANREDLLLAVYTELIEDATRTCLDAVQALEDEQVAPVTRAERVDCGLRHYVGHVVEDPRRVRILHLEVRTVPSLEGFRGKTMRAFSDQVRKAFRLPEPQNSQGGRVLSLALVGAVSEVLAVWVASPEPRMAVSEMIEELSAFCTGALSALLPGE